MFKKLLLWCFLICCLSLLGFGKIRRYIFTVCNGLFDEKDKSNIEQRYNISKEELHKKKNHQKYFWGEDIDFVSSFILRDVKSKYNKDITIIPTAVAIGIKDLVDTIQNSFIDSLDDPSKKLQSCVKHVDIFLFSNPTLITNQLIFLPVNKTGFHWNGVCAVNPGVFHIEENKLCRTGCISFNGCQYTERNSPTSQNQLYLVFFLNLALHYYKAYQVDQLNYIRFHTDNY